MLYLITISKKLWEELKKLNQSITARVEDFGAQYIAFGIFGVINHPVYYLIWKYLALQSYENIGLRITATLLCIPLVFKNYWPSKLRPWLPTYWYLTLLFCLPFFFSFMLLKNQAPDVWLMSTTIVLVWLMLLVDWLSFVVILTLGVSLAWICFALTTITPFEKNDFVGLIAQYIGSLAVVLIFARNKEKLQKEKLKTIATVGASIAHELRTPLRTISSGINSIQKCLHPLVYSYEHIDHQKFNVPQIEPKLYKQLPNIFNNVKSETRAAFTIIDMLLVKVNQFGSDVLQTETCSMVDCVNEVIRRYPFDKDELDLIRWNSNNDFIFAGDKPLIIHLLFNLLKNSLYYIRVARRGNISIWLEKDEKYNMLYFRDTGAGIPAKILPYIFDRFFTQTRHGTGIGLAFCKAVMEGLNGKITCRSEAGEFTEFVLYFPHKAIA